MRRLRRATMVVAAFVFGFAGSAAVFGVEPSFPCEGGNFDFAVPLEIGTGSPSASEAVQRKLPGVDLTSLELRVSESPEGKEVRMVRNGIVEAAFLVSEHNDGYFVDYEMACTDDNGILINPKLSLEGRFGPGEEEGR